MNRLVWLLLLLAKLISVLIIVGVAGFAPSHVRHSFIWNRVANPSGKPDGNIGLDLCNEHLNLEFKGKNNHILENTIIK